MVDISVVNSSVNPSSGNRRNTGCRRHIFIFQACVRIIFIVHMIVNPNGVNIVGYFRCSDPIQSRTNLINMPVLMSNSPNTDLIWICQCRNSPIDVQMNTKSAGIISATVFTVCQLTVFWRTIVFEQAHHHTFMLYNGIVFTDQRKRIKR
ncbi:hypothetical protein D3C80_946500 [compost metagenome]